MTRPVTPTAATTEGPGDDWTQGRDLFRAERYEEAIPFLERAANAERGAGADQRGPALNYLGTAQYALGRYEDAVTTFRAAILQTPGKARLHYNLGNSLLGVGRAADARRQYELALDLDPDYEEAARALAVVVGEVDTARPAPPPPADENDAAAPAEAEDALPAATAPPAPSAAATQAETGSPTAGADGANAVAGLADAGYAQTRRRVLELDARIRAAAQAVSEARAHLEQQEQALAALLEELSAAVRAYDLAQEATLEAAALQRAQTLLAQAAGVGRS